MCDVPAAEAGIVSCLRYAAAVPADIDTGRSGGLVSHAFAVALAAVSTTILGSKQW